MGFRCGGAYIYLFIFLGESKRTPLSFRLFPFLRGGVFRFGFFFSSFSSSCLWVPKYFSYRLRLGSRRWTILIEYSSIMGIIAMELYVFSLLRSYDVSSLGMECIAGY